MQDTDFNGVVSFMLNCTRFDSKFSFPITTGKPTHNAACLLYKAREIVKAVRHSSIMKVTDVDLQNYFTTFTSLLSDSQYLSQDSDAQNAVKKLAQLEKDTLLLTTTEMMCSLAAVSTFLKQQLRDVAKDVVDASVNDLRVNTGLCIGSIKAYLVKCKKDFNENADKLTQAFDENADKHMQAFYENADKHMQSFDENADKHTQSFDENADKRTQALDENAEKHTQDYNELTAIRTRKFDEHADKRTQEYDELTDIRKKDFDENADKRLRDINELLGNTIFTETSYKQSCEELLRAMMKHYAKTLSHVTTSPLNDWVQARLDDIYMPPDLQLMKKVKGSFIKTGTQITEYMNVFLTDGEQSRHTFIQGEAGSGKSTFLAKLIMDWCSASTRKSVEAFSTAETNSGDHDSRLKCDHFFKDLKILTSYKFIFHVTLRDSLHEFDILEMIKQQIIDSIYSKEDRDTAYTLLNEIMKRERCLVLLDGLDEWTGTVGHNLPTLAVSLSQCDMLITTRPWKMTQSKIPDSKIDTLLQLEGVNKPFDISKRLLACRGDYNEIKDLDFESYVFKNDLYKLLFSPMMLSLIVHSWAEGTELKGSRCEIYSLLLESLIKKVNSETSEFQQPPYRCFTATQYIQPNIENLNNIAEAAFYLLFSDTREKALVFTITELNKFNLGQIDQENFALKSGILSATRKASSLRSYSSFSFIHKSIQEFLAAYHIARNTNLIDDVISGYLNSHEDAYLDISQVFIFLCGLNMSAANTLSGTMDEHDVVKFDRRFQDIILTGHREAVANQQTDILLKLSRYTDVYDENIRDLHSIWTQNKSNVLKMRIHVLDRKNYASHIEFKLSSCINLKSLELDGNGILLSDSASSVITKHPVRIVLKGAGPPQCADSIPVLPSIEEIILRNVTCSSSCLLSLFSTLLTVNHEVFCCLQGIFIECQEGAKWKIRVLINKGLDMKFSITINDDSPYIWKVLHGLNIKTLCLSGDLRDLDVHHVEWSRSLSSLTHLETLEIETTQVNLFKALHGLNIKSLSIDQSHINVDYVDSCSQSLASLKHLETLSIKASNNINGLWKALHGLAIKRLIIEQGDLNMDDVESPSQSLSSLTQLEMLILSFCQSAGSYVLKGPVTGNATGVAIVQSRLPGGNIGIPPEQSRAMALSFIAEWTSGDTRDETEPGLGGISNCLGATGEE
ncbi:uncharacterized protein LOC127854590 [Dreissena polymorpha]|uniref:uncharacterized protein LOC127854590 n=1 Tax=Dreissena polymorpha TaxID=45954 RepID=UPI002264DDEE|nr:uncharacterized protein LOC127854590 [Dreissena polymorpha]